jgi:hypothetical protein
MGMANILIIMEIGMKEGSRMIKCKIKFQNFTKKLKFKKKKIIDYFY